MSDIASISHLHSAAPSVHSAPAIHANSPSTAESTSVNRLEAVGTCATRSQDRIEISTHARLMEQLRQMPDVRLDRIEEARTAIARGIYETPERLDAAMEGLVADLRA